MPKPRSKPRVPKLGFQEKVGSDLGKEAAKEVGR